MTKIDKTIAHIRELERRLGEVDNNLRYIKVVQALKKSLDNLRTTIVRYSNAEEIPINLHGLFLQWWWILTL